MSVNNTILPEKITEIPEKITEIPEEMNVVPEEIQEMPKKYKNITVINNNLQCNFCDKIFTI